MHIDTKIRIHLCVYTYVFILSHRSTLTDLSVFLSVCLSICLSVSLSVFLPVCLSVCLSVSLRVHLCILLSVSHDTHFIGVSCRWSREAYIRHPISRDSWHTFEWVTSHIKLFHDTRWMRHVTCMTESCHTYDWVMSRPWPRMLYSASDMKWVMAHMDHSWHTWMNHVTHMKESWHAPE